MNILLVGGTGVLSSAVTAEAIKKGFGVTMINRGLRKIPDSVELIRSNNKSYKEIEALLGDRKFDAVIDFLCYNKVDLHDSFELYSKHTNQYFFISSCSVYDTTRNEIYSEDSPKVTKSWPYSVEKWESEEELARLASKTNCKYTVVRPCLTYGDTRFPYGISPEFRKHWTLIARILEGKPIIRWNRGENRWNMMRVEEFAVGLVGLIGREEAFNEAFNICGDEMPSYEDVLSAFEMLLGKKVIRVDMDATFYARYLPSWLAGELIGGRCANLTCSNAKLKKIVPEFGQRINLLEGMKLTLAAYRRDNYQLGIDWLFDAQTDYIVEKWNRIQGSPNDVSLHFIDYLHNARLNDRYDYWRVRYKDSLFVKSACISTRIANRVVRMFK